MRLLIAEQVFDSGDEQADDSEAWAAGEDISHLMSYGVYDEKVAILNASRVRELRAWAATLPAGAVPAEIQTLLDQLNDEIS